MRIDILNSLLCLDNGTYKRAPSTIAKGRLAAEGDNSTTVLPPKYLAVIVHFMKILQLNAA